MATPDNPVPLSADQETQGDRISASSPMRPTSAHTLHSTFADSAVDMDTPNPTEPPNATAETEKSISNQIVPQSDTDIDQSLSDKMRQLAAVAWTLEQGDDMTIAKRLRLHELLRTLESHLDTEDDETAQHGTQPSLISEAGQEVLDPTEDEEEDEDDIWIDESDLIAVRGNLATTLKAMRARHEEQNHLHQLTAFKLEAVAQRCLEHERKSQTLLADLRRLEEENRSLRAENSQLREKGEWLEDEASRNEVAVEAMSSAVMGLEGWIESTHPSRAQTPIQLSKGKRQRVVTRGKGRFRGRYYVDEDGDAAVAYSMADMAAESQELHDGVKAWLRGFRDVEEELRQHDSPPRTRRPGKSILSARRDEDDDWGDFQGPDRVR